MLYDPARHVTLNEGTWSEDFVRTSAHKIFDFLCSGFSETQFWPAHPGEGSRQPFNHSLYNGASGTLWALVQLSRKLDRALPFDPISVAHSIYRSYCEKPDTGSIVPSYFLGACGILSVAQSIAPDKIFDQQLSDSIRENTRNPVNEALWGSPGTMLPALRFGKVELYLDGANYLFEKWLEKSDGLWIWTQDLYGQISNYMGPAHGFFGNAYALLEGKDHLSTQQRTQLLDRVEAVAVNCAVREDGFANWFPHFEARQGGRAPLVQWCHGAPGTITALRSFPKNHSPELESLLLDAGELIWKAGPLEKGIGLCHGTDGNGYALLRLFERTQDEKWLDRAKHFAMHALTQRNGRYSLWTGESGLALFALDCIDGTADFPTLDFI